MQQSQADPEGNSRLQLQKNFSLGNNNIIVAIMINIVIIHQYSKKIRFKYLWNPFQIQAVSTKCKKSQGI